MARRRVEDVFAAPRLEGNSLREVALQNVEQANQQAGQLNNERMLAAEVRRREEVDLAEKMHHSLGQADAWGKARVIIDRIMKLMPTPEERKRKETEDEVARQKRVKERAEAAAGKKTGAGKAAGPAGGGKEGGPAGK